MWAIIGAGRYDSVSIREIKRKAAKSFRRPRLDSEGEEEEDEEDDGEDMSDFIVKDDEEGDGKGDEWGGGSDEDDDYRSSGGDDEEDEDEDVDSVSKAKNKVKEVASTKKVRYGNLIYGRNSK